jgi:hypothetical protein
MVSSVAHSELEILERAIDASGSAWPPELARAILSIKLIPGDLTRMNELAAKSSAGTLDADEEMQLDSYRFAARLLEILKLRARMAMKGSSAALPPTA